MIRFSWSIAHLIVYKQKMSNKISGQMKTERVSAEPTCIRERERETGSEREGDRDIDRERERERETEAERDLLH